MGDGSTGVIMASILSQIDYKKKEVGVGGIVYGGHSLTFKVVPNDEICKLYSS